MNGNTNLIFWFATLQRAQINVGLPKVSSKKHLTPSNYPSMPTKCFSKHFEKQVQLHHIQPETAINPLKKNGIIRMFSKECFSKMDTNILHFHPFSMDKFTFKKTTAESSMNFGAASGSQTLALPLPILSHLSIGGSRGRFRGLVPTMGLLLWILTQLVGSAHQPRRNSYVARKTCKATPQNALKDMPINQ